MKRIIFYLSIIVVLLFSCTQPANNAAAQAVPRDTTVNVHNAYTQMFFDSTAMEKFIHETSLHDSVAKRLRNFYNARNYEYAWFFSDGVADYTTTFLQMQNDYIAYSADSSLYNPQLQQLLDSLSEGAPAINIAANNKMNLELTLTAQFFRFAHRAYQGSSRLNAQDLGWFIPRKKINTIAVLDSLIKNKGKNVYEPVNRQYNLLKDYLFRYYALSRKGSWRKINFDKKSYALGDTSSVIIQVKKVLLQEGDLTKNDTTALFDTTMQQAVKSYQRRFGLKEDGIIGSDMINVINTPPEEYIQKILINMERIRWVPAQPATDYILVNIPEFRLHVYENGNYRFSMNVVVGTKMHNTVIFNGTLKYIVFSPYWNVPSSILRNEILPAMQRNRNYLAAHNMEWNGNSVRQKPGPSNALGLVKFLFPNNYNIYLHDTPSKNLFGESTRAFSHGCIRISEPEKLAEFLLRNDRDWDTEKITQAMNAGKEKYVTLKNPVPVFVGYFTAWVDREGKLNFRDDLYGHDKKMADHLFAKNALK